MVPPTQAYASGTAVDNNAPSLKKSVFDRVADRCIVAKEGADVLKKAEGRLSDVPGEYLDKK